MRLFASAMEGEGQRQNRGCSVGEEKDPHARLAVAASPSNAVICVHEVEGAVGNGCLCSCCLTNSSISYHASKSDSSGLLVLSISEMAFLVESSATHHSFSEATAFQPPFPPQRS